MQMSSEMNLHPTTDGLDLCDFFDQFGPFAFQLPTVETIMAKAWLYAVPTITQDDRDAVHDALLDILRCPDCSRVLTADDLWDVHGHANGCDVDETVFACLCGTSGVL
jgi:hypothetical protein